MIRNPAGSPAARTCRYVVAAMAIASDFAAMDARADVLLDTYGPGNSTAGFNLGVSNNGLGAHTSLAVSFSTASTVSIDSILAALTGTGTAAFGIMSDASGLPSNSFLYSVLLDDPAPSVSLSGLGWTLGAGTYWLAAVGNPGFNGSWDTAFRTGVSANDSTLGVPGWSVSVLNPAARVTTAVPEPETYAMLLAGLGLLGFMVRRRADA